MGGLERRHVFATAAIFNTAAMPANTWNHVVLVAGGATRPYRAIYINGVLSASNNTGSSGPATALGSLQLFRSLENAAKQYWQVIESVGD